MREIRYFELKTQDFEVSKIGEASHACVPVAISSRLISLFSLRLSIYLQTSHEMEVLKTAQTISKQLKTAKTSSKLLNTASELLYSAILRCTSRRLNQILIETVTN
jgi:hypothetical protein